MKKLLISVFCCLLVFSCSKENLVDESASDINYQSLTINGYYIQNLHRPKKGCNSGFWFCGYWADPPGIEKTTFVHTSNFNGDKMDVTIRSSYAEAGVEFGSNLYAEPGEEIVLDNPGFGVSSITILPGDYSTELLPNGFIKATVNISYVP